MRRANVDFGAGAAAHQHVESPRQSPGGVDDVLNHDRRLALHLADDLHRLLHVFPNPALEDDRQRQVQPVRQLLAALHGAVVGRHHHGVGQSLVPHIVREQGHGAQMIDGNVEESLDLPGVEIHRQHAMGPSRHQQVGHQAAGDRFAGGVLLVLARIAVVWRHRGNPPGRRPPQRIHHNQQFHEVLIDRVAGRLKNKGIDAAGVLLEPHVNLAVGEPCNVDPALRNLEIRRDLFTQRGSGRAAEEFQFAVSVVLRHTASTLPRIVSRPPGCRWAQDGTGMNAGTQDISRSNRDAVGHAAGETVSGPAPET